MWMMMMGRAAGMLLVAGLLGGCDAIDRVRTGGGEQEARAAAAGLSLALQIPGMLRAGQEGTVRLSVTNRGDSIPTGLRVDLIVPGWLELAPPRPGEREVILAAAEGEGTRFSYRMDEPPLEPGETQILEQRVRVPPESAAGAARGASGRLVRARLVNAQGQVLTEVQGEVALDSAFLGAAQTAAEASADPRDQLGPLRLGMTTAELRQAASGARDTSWSQEGMTERGLLVPVSGGDALAVLVGDSVARIVVAQPGPATREGLGVGSTMQELRDAYGRACAAPGEGIIAVWFPAAPGISYAVDVPFSSATEFQRNPAQIPGSARVTRWWLRRGTDDCPVAGG
jgi:hypothetical protein